MQDETTNSAAPTDATVGTSGTQPESQTPEAGSGSSAHEAPDGQRQQADGGSEAATSGSDTGEQKPKSKYQKRIERLNEQVRHYQTQAEHYRGLWEKGGQAKPLDPLSFKTDAEYQAALIEQTVNRTQSEFAKTQAQSAVEQQAAAEQEIWGERVADLKESVPDFEAVAYSDKVIYSKHGLEMVRRLAEGPRVAYYLGKNPQEAQRIAQLAPLETAFELGRLEAKLTSGQPRRVSNAPAPVQTVRGGGVLGTPDPNKMEMGEYAAWYAKRNQSSMRH